MKRLLAVSLLVPLAFVTPTQAQQVNVYGESYCYTNTEQYVQGYYDSYGRYIPGYVNRTRNQVPCNNVVVNQQPYYYRQRVCNPAAGAAMGAGLAEALSGGSGWKYNSYSTRRRNSSSHGYSYRNYKSNGWTLFGAGLGALMYSC
jgi:hypothetical protein